MLKNRILLTFIMTSLALNAATAPAKTKVEEVKKVEVKEVEKEVRSIELETTFKFNYNMHINADFSDYKNTDEDKNKDAFDTEETNSYVYKENAYNIEIFNSKFKFTLYDDIELFIPFGVSHKFSYPEEILDKINKYYLVRAFIANVGFNLSWNALDYLKLGINGDYDEDAAYAFSLENKLFRKKDNELDTEGRDIFKYGLGIFGQFEYKNDLVEFKPKLRLKVNKGRELKAKDEDDKNLAPVSGSLIFTPLVALPLEFKYDLMEDLKFIANFSLNSYMAFVNENYLKAIKYENSGLKVDTSLKLSLEYKLFNMLKLVLPIKASSNNELFRNEAATTDWMVNAVHVGPKIDFNCDVLDNLKFLFDVAVDYKICALTLNNHGVNISQFYSNPKIKFGAGFKFDSAL